MVRLIIDTFLLASFIPFPSPLPSWSCAANNFLYYYICSVLLYYVRVRWCFHCHSISLLDRRKRPKIFDVVLLISLSLVVRTIHQSQSITYFTGLISKVFSKLCFVELVLFFRSLVNFSLYGKNLINIDVPLK